MVDSAEFFRSYLSVFCFCFLLNVKEVCGDICGATLPIVSSTVTRVCLLSNQSAVSPPPPPAYHSAGEAVTRFFFGLYTVYFLTMFVAWRKLCDWVKKKKRKWFCIFPDISVNKQGHRVGLVCLSLSVTSGKCSTAQTHRLSSVQFAQYIFGYNSGR